MSFIVSDDENDEEYNPPLKIENEDIEDDEYLNNEFLENGWKKNLTQKDIKIIGPKLRELISEMKQDVPTLKNIVNAQISHEDKKECLYHLYVMNDLDTQDERWWEIHQLLHKKLKSKSTLEINNVESYEKRIMNLNASNDVKSALFTVLRSIGETGDDAHSRRKKLEGLLQLPYDTVKNVTVSIEKASKMLDDELYGMHNVKRIFLEILASSSTSTSFPVIGLVGPPGTGKTHISTIFAKCMGLEMYSVLIGGAKDTSIIHGGDNMWVGSSCGQIARGLQSMKISNGVFFFDELDKTCNDIYNSLLHIFDFTSNKYFRDQHYSEIELDLSRCKFIVSMNSLENIPKPLLNRLCIIHINGYSQEEKLEIAQNYLIPRIINENHLSISPQVLQSIIKLCDGDDGVRILKNILQRIQMHINLCVLSSKNQYALLPKSIKFPYKLTFKDVEMIIK